MRRHFNLIFLIVIVSFLMILGTKLFEYKTRKINIIEVENCNGKLDTIDVVIVGDLEIQTYKMAVPVLVDSRGKVIYVNCCKFNVLEILD